jgi:hypothetical protein
VQETRFFRALESMTVIEVSGTVVILRNDAGRKMVFQSDAP